jgi:hypothetical protein
METKMEMNRTKRPRTHKPQLLLQDTVHQFTVLARLRLVDFVVRAHDGADACVDGFGEGPEIELGEMCYNRDRDEGGGEGINEIRTACRVLSSIFEE